MASIRIRTDILDADLKRARLKLDAGFQRIQRGAATVALRTLVDTTRVDTGKAVSNWRVGVGKPTTAEIEPYSKGSRGSTAGACRAAAIEAGNQRINTSPLGKEIYIANNVRYISYLNDGSPHTGAGDHMAEQAVAQGRAWVEAQRIE